MIDPFLTFLSVPNFGLRAFSSRFSLGIVADQAPVSHKQNKERKLLDTMNLRCQLPIRQEGVATLAMYLIDALARSIAIIFACHCLHLTPFLCPVDSSAIIYLQIFLLLTSMTRVFSVSLYLPCTMRPEARAGINIFDDDTTALQLRLALGGMRIKASEHQTQRDADDIIPSSWVNM